MILIPSELEKSIRSLVEHSNFQSTLPRQSIADDVLELNHSPEPNNLYVLDHFLRSYDLNGHHSLLPAPLKECVLSLTLTLRENYLHLRSLQNKDWAIHHTSEGIELAQKNDLKGAIKKYGSALDMDPACVEAWVARGAAYVFSVSFQKDRRI